MRNTTTNLTILSSQGAKKDDKFEANSSKVRQFRNENSGEKRPTRGGGRGGRGRGKMANLGDRQDKEEFAI